MDQWFLKVLQKFPPTLAFVHGWLFPAGSKKRRSKEEGHARVMSAELTLPIFLAPTRSRGRPLPKRKISGLKSLALGSFFVPESWQTEGRQTGRKQRRSKDQKGRKGAGVKGAGVAQIVAFFVLLCLPLLCGQFSLLPCLG